MKTTTLEKLNNLKPTLVEWEDATTQDFILNEENKSKGAIAPLISVGFLLEDNKDFTMVAGDCFFRETTYKVEDRFRGVVGIPNTFIKMRYSLEVSEKKTDLIAVRWWDARYTNVAESKFRSILVDEHPPKEVLSIGKIFSEKDDKLMFYQTEDTFLKKSDRVMTLRNKFIVEKLYLCTETKSA